MELWIGKSFLYLVSFEYHSSSKSFFSNNILYLMGALLTKCLNFIYQNLISKETERFIQLNFRNICKFLCASLAKTHFVFRQIKKKLNQSRYRPGVAQRVPGSQGSQISWRQHRMVVRLSSLPHRPPSPPGNTPGTHFC